MQIWDLILVIVDIFAHDMSSYLSKTIWSDLVF